MKPIVFSGIARLLHPAETLLGRRCRRVVLEPDPPTVPTALEQTQHEAVIDLARARLAAPGGVGDLDVPYPRQQAGDRLRQVPLHSLHVVDVVLERDVLGADGVEEANGLCRRVQQIRSVLLRVDGFDHDGGALRPGLLGGPGYVLARHLELGLDREPDPVHADERVEARASDPRGELERDRDVRTELLPPVRVAGEPAVAAGHVARVDVEQLDLELRLGHGARHRIDLIQPRPHERDAGEARIGGSPEPLVEGDVFEQEAEVRGKSHGEGLRHRMHMGRVRDWFRLALLAATCLAALGWIVQTAAAESNGLAPTPPMGWNDWYSSYCNVNAQLVELTAQEMVNNGMKAAGYD